MRSAKNLRKPESEKRTEREGTDIVIVAIKMTMTERMVIAGGAGTTWMKAENPTEDAGMTQMKTRSVPGNTDTDLTTMEIEMKTRALRGESAQSGAVMTGLTTAAVREGVMESIDQTKDANMIRMIPILTEEHQFQSNQEVGAGARGTSRLEEEDTALMMNIMDAIEDGEGVRIKSLTNKDCSFILLIAFMLELRHTNVALHSFPVLDGSA